VRLPYLVGKETLNSQSTPSHGRIHRDAAAFPPLLDVRRVRVHFRFIAIAPPLQVCMSTSRTAITGIAGCEAGRVNDCPCCLTQTTHSAPLTGSALSAKSSYCKAATEVCPICDVDTLFSPTPCESGTRISHFAPSHVYLPGCSVSPQTEIKSPAHAGWGLSAETAATMTWHQHHCLGVSA
jgi:hypothetical protein